MKFKDYSQESHNRSDLFLKLEDGKSISGVFRGEIFEFWQIWPKGGAKQVFDKPTPGARVRFKVNFVDEHLKPWILEFPLTVHNQLADINNTMPLERTKVKLVKSTGQSFVPYNIICLGPIPAEGLKKIEAVKLNVLDGTQKPKEDVRPPEQWPETPDFDDSPMPGEDDIPF